MKERTKIRQMKESRVFVGMGGWQLEPFNGVFYPANPPRGFRKLEFYSRFLDAVEINATFYTTALNPKNVQQWLGDVSQNKNFVFTVKLFKGFTHDLNATQEDIRSVHQLLLPLADNDKLGGLIIQFPYSFTSEPERREYLARLAKAFHQYILFVEVRHNSWNTEDMKHFFQDHELHVVNVDLPGFKRHIPLTDAAWGGLAYFRMMGRNVETWDRSYPRDGERSVSDRYRYRYSEEELQHLLELIDRVRPQAGKIYVVFHNDPEANSLFNGFQLRRLLKPTENLAAPENLVKTFPQLREFTMPVVVERSPEASPTLFDT